MRTTQLNLALCSKLASNMAEGLSGMKEAKFQAEVCTHVGSSYFVYRLEKKMATRTLDLHVHVTLLSGFRWNAATHHLQQGTTSGLENS